MLSELWSELRFRWRALFRRGAVDAELDEEVRFHLEHETAKLDGRRAMPRRGAAPGPARVRRRRTLKEESRDGRGRRSWLETSSSDLRYAVRGLRGRPAASPPRWSSRWASGSGPTRRCSALSTGCCSARRRCFGTRPGHRLFLGSTYRGRATRDGRNVAIDTPRTST